MIDNPKSTHLFIKINLKTSSSGSEICKDKIELNLVFKSFIEKIVGFIESHKTGILKGWVLKKILIIASSVKF